MTKIETTFKDGPIPLSDADLSMMESTVNLAAPLSEGDVGGAIFDACVSAADHETADGVDEYRGREITAAVIQAIIDRTPSPATVVELTRILREGGVEVAEATFD